MTKYLLTLLCIACSNLLFATDFITRWDLNKPGLYPNSITFGIATSGIVSYTWETIPAGSSGSGVINGTIAQINGLPIWSVIRLHINATNLNRININNGTDKQRLVDVEQWGSVAWNNMQTAFLGCSNMNISANDIPDLTLVSSMDSMFYGCGSLNGPININNWNTSNVIDMSYMFMDASSFNQAIGNWNTSNVTIMSNMFQSASSFNQPIGNWNTNNVTDMSYMFTDADSFNQPIGNWNTSNVIDMSYMFDSTFKFNQPIGNWNVSNVTDMSYMFAETDTFSQYIGNWNTSNVTDMSGMFAKAFSFNQPIGNWNTNNVTDMFGMFQNANLFNQSIGNWNTSNVTDMSYMFQNAYQYNQSLGNWILNPSVNLMYMLNDCGMDCSIYTSTLLGWASNSLTPSGRYLGATNMHYNSTIQTNRNYLINTKGWSISGDALDVGFCCAKQYDNLNITTCNLINFNGQTLVLSGIYKFTLLNVNGCDSIITINLTSNCTTDTLHKSDCNSYFFNGQTLTSGGVYFDTLMNANGCDSLLVLYLTIGVNNSVYQIGTVLGSNATGATYQWLTCPSYTPIVGETNQSFIATTNGDYAVAVTENGCTDTSACYTVIGIGINENETSSSFSVYPNPVSEKLYIQSSVELANKKKEFYNSLGQLLFTTKRDIIDVSAYAKGIYYLKCEHQVVKVVVE